MKGQTARKSPWARLGELPPGGAVWKSGFWKEKFDLCKDIIAPNIYRIFDDETLSHGLANFRIAAGDREGSHRGAPFIDGDIYKWLEGASWIDGLSGGGEMEGRINALTALIRRVQRADGYIFTPQAIRERRGEGREKSILSSSLNFEIYNLGHLISAGCARYRTAGKGDLLEAAKKAAACLEEFLNQDMEDQARTAICPSHYMALADLYRTTGERRYLETARRAIALRDRVENGTDDNQDRLPLRSHREILGHAVRATYLYAGVADLYMETGDPSLLETLDAVWKDETGRKISINGGVGALYDGVSPQGHAGDHPRLARTHQAFGRPYELPNITAYNETCAAVGNILWAWRMFLIHGDPRCAGLVERTFYNLILASVSLDGTRYFYTNPLRREETPLPYHLKWSRTREPCLSSFCCPPNMMRILAASPSFCYALSDGGVYTGLYGASRARIELSGGRRFTLVQETDYPWEGTILLRVEEGAAADWTLWIRVPSWVRAGTIRAPGEFRRELGPEDADTFVPLERTWKAGDETLIGFSLEAEINFGHPLIEETNGHAAVTRGPLLYCAESCDHPGGVWHTLGIRNGAAFRERRLEIGGTELVALETGQGLSYDSPPGAEGALYRRAGAVEVREETLRLIPYFAWDNRALGGMKVWLPFYP